MQLFETLFLLLILLSAFTFNSKKKNLRPLILALTAICLVLHIYFEGFRWQLTLAYCVVILFLVLFKKPKLSKLILTLCVFGIIFSAVITTFLPALKHNKNSGEHLIGTYIFETFDTKRQRKLPVKAWFPIHKKHALRKALWMQSYEVTGPEIARRAGMPNFIFKHLANSKPAYISNPANALDDNKPLILLSHGRGATKEFNAFMAQEFASHGYIVIAADHTKGGLLSVFQDGTNVAFSPKEFGENEGLEPRAKQERVQELGIRWAQDLSVVLTDFQKQFPRYRNRKVIVGGHSTGGGSTIQYCATEKNCLGVMALDPWLEPISDQFLEHGINKPLLSFFSDPYEKDFAPINHQRFEKIADEMLKKNIFTKEVVIAKSGHIDFCDAALLSPYSYIFGQDKGRIKTQTVMRIVNQHALNFSRALSEKQDLNKLSWQKFPEEMSWVSVP